MDKSQPRKWGRKPLIFLLVKRGVSFFFLMDILTVFLYAAGTAQEFTDPTQVLLLRLSVLFGLLLGCGALYGIILNVYFFFTRNARQKKEARLPGGETPEEPRRGPTTGFIRPLRWYLINTLFYVILGPLGLAVSFAMAFILSLTGGNVP
jgi:hypothetical protein